MIDVRALRKGMTVTRATRMNDKTMKLHAVDTVMPDGTIVSACGKHLSPHFHDIARPNSIKYAQRGPCSLCATAIERASSRE